MERENLKKLVGEVLRVTVEKVVFGGDGLARTGEGAVLMAPFVLPGEVVEVKVEKARKGHLTGRLSAVVSPSPRRVSPRCEYFGRCGGCQYQHIEYPAQCEIKHAQVGETLSRLGKFSDEKITEILKDMSPSPREYGYRNRVVLHWNGRGKYGYYGDTGKGIVAVERCPIANDEINEQLGDIRRLPVETGRPELMLLGFRPEWINVSKEEINVTLHDKLFTFSTKCFFQPNIFVFQDVLDYMLGLLEERGGDVLVELYCGIGLLTVLASAVFKKAVGFDINSNNIGYARRNAERSGAGNAEFSTSDAANGLKRLRGKGVRPDTLVVDPPREGLGWEALDEILSANPERIIYMSCDPTTFVRDVLRLSERFDLASLKPFDMFPQTYHIEVVGVLKRK